MRDNISPEEKLLRLIRGHKKTTDAKAADSVPGAASDFKKAAFFKKTYFQNITQKYLSAKHLYKIILLCLIGSFLYLGFCLAYPFLNLPLLQAPTAVEEKILDLELESKIAKKSFDYYLAKIKDRQIFNVVKPQETARPQSSADLNLIQDLTLVGVISGENPQVIIEDKKSQKTYYLTKGQSLGQFQIEDIQEGKAILSYEGQKFELYL